MTGSRKNLISLGFKYRVYPTGTQREQIEELFAGIRRVHNDFVAHTKQSALLDHEAIKTSRRLTVNTLTQLPKKILEKAHQLVQNAYTKATRRGRYPPQLKSLRSFQSAHFDKGLYAVFTNGVELKGIEGRLRVCFHREMPAGKVRDCCLKRDKLGCYFISFKVATRPLRRSGKNAIGIDLGLKNFAVCSDGSVYENPRHKEHIKPHLNHRYEILRRKTPGSRNHIKVLESIRKLEEKAAQRRRHHFHYLTAKLIRENCVIGIESLDISRMMTTNARRKAFIEDAGWGLFRRMLIEKARASTGTVVVLAPPDYPSTQTCSVCENKSPIKIELGVSRWVCPVCGSHHDRDINAAVNLCTMAVRWNKYLRKEMKGVRALIGDPRRWKEEYRHFEYANVH